MPGNLVAFDVETWRIQPGLIAPPLVCASAGWWDGAQVNGQLLDKGKALELFAALLDDPARMVAGANIAYDLLVMAVSLARHGFDCMPEIWRALADDGRIFDVQIAEGLDAVAEGCLGKDPRTGDPLVNPETGRRGRYSLAICTDLVLGRTDAKANDAWRERYGELDSIPIELWPEDARTYPVDDARNTAEVALAQTGHVPRAGAHRWGPKVHCEWCGVHPKDAYVDGTYAPCRARRRARNLHDLANQVGTAYAMHKAAAWGFRVNQSSVDKIENKYNAEHAGKVQPFIDAGIIRGDGTENQAALKKLVACAYGAKDPCTACSGTGKVPSPVTNGRTKINCDACNGTALLLPRQVPRTETGQVGKGEDVLHESGDEFLMSYAIDHKQGAKIPNVYIPYLRSARQPIAGHVAECPVLGDGKKRVCSCPGPYHDVPLTLWPNVLLETGRTSYGGVIQLFPRKGGLRECIEARDGWVFSSEDYEAGELITHAQSCLWICGDSQLAKALIGGMKVHNLLGATMIGMTYEDFQRRVKEPQCKDARQAAKPGNFGFPGGMGPVKMVLQQRKQGPDTPHPSGPTMIKDDAGNLVPGYKGLRFCLLMDNADRCGGEGNMLYEWNDELIAPTCKRCVDCAKRLKATWLKQWPENEEYFRYVNDCCQNGQLITDYHLELWPHLRDFFVPNARLAPGEIMQHVSGRIRGGVDYCSCANGFFQGLLADIAKSALRRISRECYDHTVRIVDLAHPNSHRSAYVGGSSPLLGHRPIVFAHDEIILEHPESEAHDGAMRVSEIMVEEMMFYCPDLVKACAAEPTLMRRWYKGASTTWQHGSLDPTTGKRDRSKRAKDQSDKLVPWEPA